MVNYMTTTSPRIEISSNHLPGGTLQISKLDSYHFSLNVLLREAQLSFLDIPPDQVGRPIEVKVSHKVNKVYKPSENKPKRAIQGEGQAAGDTTTEDVPAAAGRGPNLPPLLDSGM